VETLGADSVVLALGQETDLALLEDVPGVVVQDGVVQVDDRLMTGRPGLFAGGDAVPAERSVTVGVGHGRRAARAIDDWLRRPSDGPPPVEQTLADFAALNTWYYADAPRAHRDRLEAVRRQTGFEEVVLGLGPGTALYEARRCMSCGNCFSCDNCFGICPDNAVIKTGADDTPYAIDLDFCKGCGLCAEECPCGAIEMVPEEV
jgi:Pyruvate/2-oxoacid:ferredoxin oxidoreductase delta subunit